MSNKKPFIPNLLRTVVATALLTGICCTTAAEEQSRTLQSSSRFQESLIEQYSRSQRELTLPLPGGEEVTVDVSFYSFEDNYLSIGGTIKGNADSEFMMKIDKGAVYGWIHIFAEPMEAGTVYKYSATMSGTVTVSTVPVTDIIAISNKKGSAPLYPKTSRNRPELRAEELPPLPFFQPVDESTSINELQSKPGLEKVFWLDIRDIMDGETPKVYTREEMIEIWRIVASGYSTYDVNVTTSQAIFEATDPDKRGLSLFHNNSDGRSHCGFDAFGTTADCEIYLEPEAFQIGRTTVHEFSHLVGVHEQGTGLNGVQWLTYFPGYDDVKWCPIMGNYHYSNEWGEETLYQWSDGNFDAKGQSEGYPKKDNLTIMAKYLDPVKDETPATRSLLIKDGKLSMADNYGMINIITGDLDKDDYSFTIVDKPSQVDLHIDRIGHFAGAQLDVHAALLDESGKVLLEDNQFAARYANLQIELQPGTYTLRIAGGSEAFSSTDFANGGFNSYGSVGYYGISGTISNAKVGVISQSTTANSKILNWKNNRFTFEGIPQSDNLTLRVYNVNGRVMVQKSIHGVGSLNLQQTLGNGCYIFELNGKSHNHSERFIVSK